MATQKKAKPAGAATEGVEVTAKVDGFRRAGREWHGTSTVPLSELTSQELEAIEAEPMLIAKRVAVEAPQT